MITDTTVRTPGPFQFDHTLAFVAGFSPMAGEQTVRARTITKAISVGGAAVVYRLSFVGTAERPGLRVELHTHRPLDEPTRRAVVERVVGSFGARDDLDEYHAVASRDRAFAPLLAAYRGLRHVRFPSPFEAACWGVINQRVQPRVARSMKDALVNEAGPRLVVDGEEHRAFPEAAVLADLGEAGIARLVPGHRGRAVAAVARAFSGVDERFLREAPVDDVRAWLRDIHGVGPFTSGFVLYRGLGRFDGASVVSPRLAAAAARQYGRPMSPDDIRRTAASFGPWGGYWMLYLWASTFVPAASQNTFSANARSTSQTPATPAMATEPPTSPIRL
jgi:DNA-3-methyladenine glycosylase II